ncbi:MAG: hypothetical protein HUJ76_02675 [Parasporobacterium sp.]|nr:hypothetical protein [Parasporobacterium sp.]
MKKLTAFLIALVMAVMCFATAAQAAEVDKKVVGRYEINGYVNEYFGFRASLPSGSELQPRGAFVAANNPVEKANDESTIDSLSSLLAISPQVVFSAYTNDGYLSIVIETPGLLGGTWDKEETVVKNTAPSLEEGMRESIADQGMTLDSFEYMADEDTIMGEKHWGVAMKYVASGIPVYAVEYFIRSGDGKYLAEIYMESTVAGDVEKMVGYFSKIK